MAKAMKAMKAMAAMKAMRAMKKKAVSKIAKGKLAKLVVFRGTKAKTFWTVQDRLDQEQEWQDCEQEDVSKGQEGLRPHQGLDCCCPEGQEGFGSQGLRRSEEGNSSLQEGQGALPVSSSHEHTKASAQGVGMSTALERSCFDLNDVWYR